MTEDPKMLQQLVNRLGVPTIDTIVDMNEGKYRMFIEVQMALYPIEISKEVFIELSRIPEIRVTKKYEEDIKGDK